MTSTEVFRSPTTTSFPFPIRLIDEWESITTPRLQTLLNHAQYSQQDAAYTLAFTRRQILRRGFFGPSPSSLDKKPLWPSYLTDDHTPIEFSIDVSERDTKVRFAIEPIDQDDPFNVQAPKAYLENVRRTTPNVSLECFNTLASRLFVDERSSSATLDQAKGYTQALCAMDFNGQTPLVKAYVLLDATRKAFGEAETMRRLQQAVDELGVAGQWQSLMAYIEHARATKRDNGARVEFISVDCIDVSKARFKPYVRFSHLTKMDFLRHVRLDQTTLSDEMRQYEQLCTELWDTFCGDDDDALNARSTYDVQERTHGAIFYYEMHANAHSDAIQPKVYLPVRHMLNNDAEIGRRIDGFLAKHTSRPSGWYMRMLEQFASHRSLQSGQGIQTMLGVALKKGKPSVSVYLNPEAFS